MLCLFNITIIGYLDMNFIIVVTMLDQFPK
jgi:hypothetical protein